MPYRTVYEPAPTNPRLEVHPELPEGFVEDQSIWGDAFRHARLTCLVREIREPWEAHYCPHCGGWILGEATLYLVNNLGPLSGRSGTEFYCRRCGKEIGFSGIMS